jgi:hypothetical protein
MAAHLLSSSATPMRTQWLSAQHAYTMAVSPTSHMAGPSATAKDTCATGPTPHVKTYLLLPPPCRW